MSKSRIAVFASGSGSNAENIHQFFQNQSEIEVGLVVSDKSKAKVHERAQRLGIDALHIPYRQLLDEERTLNSLKERGITHIVLAGFLRKIPAFLIRAYPGRIINIHPALLPKYGGKGMYGQKVHQAVFDAEESTSGITIHLVDQEYDTGKLVAQYEIGIEDAQSPEEIEQKVRTLEYQYFPKVIEQWIKSST